MKANALPALVVVLVLACGQPASVPASSAAPSTAASSPVVVADPQTLQCGVFNGSEHSSATAVYLLMPPTESSALRFTWPGSLRDQPAVGSYICAHFRQAAANIQGTDPPTNVIFVSIVAAGEPGYITRP